MKEERLKKMKETDKLMTELFELAEKSNVSKIMLSQLLGVNLREIYRWKDKKNFPKSRCVVERIIAIVKLGRIKKLEF